MSSNIPSAPAYGVYASQLIRYARCCSNIGEIHYHKENKTNGRKQIEFSAESNQFEKKSKVGINEMFSNC